MVELATWTAALEGVVQESTRMLVRFHGRNCLLALGAVGLALRLTFHSPPRGWPTLIFWSGWSVPSGFLSLAISTLVACCLRRLRYAGDQIALIAYWKMVLEKTNIYTYRSRELLEARPSPKGPGLLLPLVYQSPCCLQDY